MSSGLRIRQIALVAEQLAPAVDALTGTLGIAVAFNDPGVDTFGLENAVMPVGDQFIEVVAPIKEGTAGGRYLQRRGGDGGYMVILQAQDHPPRKQRVQDLGIRTVLEFQNDAYRCMQMHPADTGGTFLEVDWAAPETWEPAGHHWREHVRTDVVNGIAAAEIQSPEPDKLAQRWSEILEIPLQGNELALDGGTIRFVDATDGRPEGLGGIDVIAADRSRAGEQHHLVGMRIKLV